ncbi:MULTISPECIES: hypothetical protein [unclassified Vibrio]|uniref:hypothetical protein n=2 Tax=Vibrio TaxID=662 RepID=UPI000B8E9BF7|nr:MULTISPECIES: hypothetical protein [unclassified Vibrio]NAW91315.1 hypothetical protein [Vibrio sp. V24_P1S3T111]OXX21199.1 hypothetical protein B9J88_12090 [Vibrio sp. V05_P4A8T149]OXX29434.1 hypothetical protein B9J81_18425 [Vibrio sp. V04_P4A5T148]OXX32502.1 hypothetical protein B9J95_06950 [Vibrio sp. V14_P6S14T42]OXX56256.1 hypothetical protein B9J91_07420 [Vibrio sp. V18_P1S4T112]
MIDKRTVHLISFPNSDLACIAAQLLYIHAGSFYEITFEAIDGIDLPEQSHLEKLGYFGYTFIEPTQRLEPAYDYVIDINYAMYQHNRRREAYQKQVYWEIDCNQNATKALQHAVSYFTSRFNIIL